MNSELGLAIPAFFAGIITFLAPCTLPLIPAYIGFISGVPFSELQTKEGIRRYRWTIFKNGLLYVFGFSLIFIAFGTTASLVGLFLRGQQIILSKIAGILVVLFGLSMLRVLRLPFLQREKHLKLPLSLEKTSRFKAFFIGIAFAVGWTPCVGLILGSILSLASTTGKALEGAFLLGMYSLGLAIPFLLIALMVGNAIRFIRKISRFLPLISFIGGLFLIFLGILLFMNRLDLLVIWGFSLLEPFGYEKIYKFL